MKDADLIKLIDRYFEGETSLEEERLLRAALKKTASSDPKVDEARAVLAYADVASLQDPAVRIAPPIKRVNGFRRVMWQAAAVAAILVIGVYATIAIKSADSGYHTMIACVEDSSKDVAFDLISSQLQAVGEASDAIEEDVEGSLNLMLDFEAD